MYYPTFDLFDDLFTSNSRNDFMKCDIVEKDDKYQLSMEMPGIKKENIHMELKNGYLKIGATTTENKEDKDSQGKVLRKERFSGSYSRSFYVGNNISQEDIKASFDNGELTILIPKNAPAKIEENHFIPIE